MRFVTADAGKFSSAAGLTTICGLCFAHASRFAHIVSTRFQFAGMTSFTDSRTAARRVFAIVPAAGHSRRMGRPKLLIAFQGRPVIEHVITAFRTGGVTEIVVVMRSSDVDLRTAVERTGAIVVCPEVDPPDMRSSIESGLVEVRRRFQPVNDDGWLMSPADHPTLDASVVEMLIARSNEMPGRLVIPTFDGRRGHPTYFPWSMTEAVAALPPDVGLNRLIQEHSRLVTEYPVALESILDDLDTPEDLLRLIGSDGS
jgi:molybdenum cofactor cytidylyltransferase